MAVANAFVYHVLAQGNNARCCSTRILHVAEESVTHERTSPLHHDAKNQAHALSIDAMSNRVLLVVRFWIGQEVRFQINKLLKPSARSTTNIRQSRSEDEPSWTTATQKGEQELKCGERLKLVTPTDVFSMRPSCMPRPKLSIAQSRGWRGRGSLQGYMWGSTFLDERDLIQYYCKGTR